MSTNSWSLAWSPDKNAVAIRSPDHHVRLFDARTHSLLADISDGAHLAVQYTCVGWGDSTSTELDSRNKSRKSKKSSRAASSGSQVVIGTSQGTILVWDVKLGEVTHRLGDGKPAVHRGSINDVSFAPVSSGHARLFACSQDKHISEWDTSSGELLHKWKGDKHAITQICVTADGTQLLSASGHIRLWDLSSKQVLATFTGHASPISSLSIREDGKYFVSAAQNDRFVNVWPLSDDLSGNEIAPSQAFTMDDAPFDVSFAPGLKKNKHVVLGVSKKQIAVWEQASKAKSAPSGPVTVLELPGNTSASDEGKTTKKRKQESARFKGEVLATHLINPKEAMILVGSPALPSFVSQSITDSDGDRLDKAVVAVARTGGVLASSGTDRAQKANGIAQVVLGPADVRVSTSKKSNATEAPEPSLEETLRTMASFHDPTENAERSQPKAAPRADSLGKVLEQALQSSDNALLESCLSVTDRKVIESTVAKLPSRYVIAFTQTIIDKFQSNPNRGVTLIVWIRAMLTHHTSYLLNVPDLVDTLQGLYQTITARLEVFRRLLKLSGRLDLVISQISRRQANAAGTASETPLHVYREGEEVMSTDDEDSDSEMASQDDSDSSMDEDSS